MLNSDILLIGTGDIANLTASGAIGTQANTVNLYSSMRLAQTSPDLDFTIPPPSLNTPGLQFELMNTGTVSFTIAGVAIGVGQAGLWVWNGTAWARVSPDQRMVTGNTIAISLAKPVGTVLTFDGINVRFGGAAAAPSLDLSVVSGTRPIRYISEYEYPGGSFGLGATFTTPLNLSTAFSALGGAFVGNGSAKTLVIDETSGNHYLITAWFYAANLTSIFVDKVGLTTSTVLANGLLHVKAAGIVNLADIVAGVRPITNGLNFASATVVGTAAGGTLNVVFTAPLTDPNYRINCTLISNVPAAIATDNTINWMVTSRTVTGFGINFKENLGVTQNISADIECTVRT